MASSDLTEFRLPDHIRTPAERRAYIVAARSHGDAEAIWHGERDNARVGTELRARRER